MYDSATNTWNLPHVDVWLVKQLPRKEVEGLIHIDDKLYGVITRVGNAGPFLMLCLTMRHRSKTEVISKDTI